jgi:transcriptional regulator with XRE-family HTH domain
VFERQFFTPEMGTALRILRLRAGLTLDEAAERMGLVGKGRRSLVSRLETGRTPDPSLRTVVRYLQVCGAYMGEFFDRFNRVDPVESRLLPEGASEQEKEIQRRVRNETFMWQSHVARPAGRKPLSPTQQRTGALRFRDYRQLANAVEAAVGEELMRLGIHPIYHLRYKAYARSVLANLRRMEPHVHASERSVAKSQRNRKEKGKARGGRSRDPELIENLGLDAQIAKNVRAVVTTKLRKIGEGPTRRV